MIQITDEMVDAACYAFCQGHDPNDKSLMSKSPLRYRKAMRRVLEAVLSKQAVK